MGQTISNLMFKSKYEDLACQTNNFFDLKAVDLDQKEFSFKELENKHKLFLLVNLASKCGFTDQNYKTLNYLHEKFGTQGLKILGFPCNQFLGQEHSCVTDLKAFLKSKKVNF